MSSANSRVAIVRATLGGALGHHRGRLLLSVLAIALGVALGFAVALINQTAVAEFVGGVKALSGQADLEVRGPRNGFDEQLLVRLARDADIAVASPVVELDARIVGRDDALRIYGIDAFRAAAVTPSLIGATVDPLALLRSETVFISPAAAAWLALETGAVLHVQSGLRDVGLSIAGTVHAEAGQRYAVMDIAAAQDAFARGGTLSRIDLRVRPGIDSDVLRARLMRELPPGLVVQSPESGASTAARMSRAYRVNLNVLALVALFTGGVLVFSTQALSVVRRRAQFALLRTLGLARGQLLRLLLLEGALVGIAGSALGLAGGYAIAAVAMRVFGNDLGAGFFRGASAQVHVETGPALAFAALGIATAVCGSFLPAREAARAVPAAALKAADESQALARLGSAVPGATALLAACAATLVPPIGGLPLAGYVSIALLLVGTLLLLPRVAHGLLQGCVISRPIAARLAFDQLRGTSGQSTVSLATIVASVSLMVSMAIMVASFRQSLDEWLEQVLPADVYVRAGATGDTAYFSPDEQQAMRALEGIVRIDFLRAQSVVLDPAQPRVALLARDLSGTDPRRLLPLIGDPYPRGPDDPPAVWISEAMVDLHGYRPGSIMHLPLAGAVHPFLVSGVWRDYARQQGALVIDRALYMQLTGDRDATDAAIWLGKSASPARFRETLDSNLGAAGITVSTSGEIRALSLHIFDRTFAVTYALEAAAVIIGLVGLSSSFGALVLARRREFGMLRHLGMTRRQIGAMLATEGVAISAIGLAIGLALGGAMSLILVHVVNRQSFHWGMTMHVPWIELGALVLGLLLLSIVTTLTSGRQAMGGDVVRAVKDDW